MNIKKFIINTIPYIFLFWIFNRLAELYRISPYTDTFGKITDIAKNVNYIFINPMISLFKTDLLIGLLVASGFRMIVYFKGKNAKKYRHGVEYGSARWGGNDIKPFIDPKFENNMILTQTERLSMTSRPKNPAHARNKNVVVIGGSGSGKTRYFIKPNLMQCESSKYPVSFVVTDPKGLLL